MTNEEVVRRFEDEFKNHENLDVVDELMTDDFVHHLPFPDLPPGRDGMKAVGRLIFGAIAGIEVAVELTVSQGDLVADRVPGRGVRRDTGAAIEWVENHIYRLRDGRIAEMWPAGGPDLS
jgi:ketosteroid isomerase-like protein